MLCDFYVYMQLASAQQMFLLFNPAQSSVTAGIIEKSTYSFFVGVAWTLFFLFQSYSVLNQRDIFYRWISVASIGMVSFWTLKWFFVVLPAWTHGPTDDLLLLIGEKVLVIGLAGSVYSFLEQKRPHQFIVIVGFGIIGVLISIASVWTGNQVLTSVGNSFSALILFYSTLNTLAVAYRRACTGAFFLACGLFIALIMSSLIAYGLFEQSEYGVYFKFPLWIMVTSRLIYIIMPVFMLARYNTNTKQQLSQKQDELRIISNEKRLLLEHQNEQLEEEVAKRTNELRIANAVKSRLFSVISHDLRSPIAALKDSLMLVQKEQLSPARFQPLMQRLTQHVDRVYKNLDNLLYWSLDQMNELHSRPAPQSINEMVNDVLELAHEMARHKKIVIHVDVPDYLMVLADEFQLRIILYNMVDNALKFSLPGSSVYIKTCLDEGRVVISIIDEGVGISAKRMALIFSDIQSSSGTAGERGTGLGLRLSRQLAERNGGTIRAFSQPGIGTRIQIILPAVGCMDNELTHSDTGDLATI